MVEPFCSVYTKSYRKFGDTGIEKEEEPCIFYSDLKENFLPSADSQAIYNPERDEDVLKNLYLNRLITTYQHDYCSSDKKKSLVIDPNNLDADAFMVHFNNYYSKRTGPLLPPPDTARRINGYCRFDRYYTGKSTYEEEISYEAYKFFKKNYDQGISRQFSKKQKSLQKQKEEESPPPPPPVEPTTKCTADSEKMTQGGKICAFCCEKFGDLAYSCPNHEKDQEKKLEVSLWVREGDPGKMLLREMSC